MIDIHLPSLLYTSATINVVMIAVLLHTRIYRRTYPGFTAWIVAVASNIVGQLGLVALESSTQSFTNSFFATFVICMPIFGWFGLRQFLELKPSLWRLMTILIASFALIMLMSLYFDTLYLRRFTVSFIGLVFCLMGLRDIRIHAAKFINGDTALLQLSLGLAIIILLTRIVTIWPNLSVHVDPILFESSRNAAVVLGLVSLRLLWVFAFLMLTQQRLELELVQSQAKTQSLANKLEELNAELFNDSRSDALTGLANRRHFDEQFAREWERHYQYKATLSVIAIDVDHFKLYNDTYGHSAGDSCLTKIGETLSDIAKRFSSLAARYGGEEFALLMPSTDARLAQVAAREILQTIEDLNCAFPASPTTKSRLSVSLGVHTTVPATSAVANSFIQEADKALYAAKRLGRNQVQVYGQD
jgi:diguanylate cyclase (GGDEF)-like protein